MNKRGFERFFADWPAKALSLAGAMTLFFFFQLNRLEERIISVPLEAELSAEMAPASQYPRSVRLTLRGESNAIYSILEGDLAATIDLSNVSAAGVARVPVKVEKRGSALGIDPLEINVDPPEVSVSLEPRASKEVRVAPSFRGFLEPGYELSSYSLEPSKVEVSGPASLVGALSEAQTEPIDLGGRSGDFSAKTKLALKSPFLSTPNDDILVFSAAVRRTLVYRSLQDIPIGYSGIHDGLVVLSKPQAGSARIAAASADLEGFTPAEGDLSADLSAIRQPGTYTVPVEPAFPEGFDVESWQPVSLTVTVGSAQGSKP